MFSYQQPQKVCRIGNIEFGGQPGEKPPVLMGNIFQKGDVMLESRKEGRFNRHGTAERIYNLERVSRETGVPAMVAIVANSVDEIKRYIDFLVSITEMPFAIDVWMEKVRLGAAQYVSELGLQDRVLYNSITPWDKDLDGQIAEIKQLGIKHVVVQVFSEEDKGPHGRVQSLKSLLPAIEKGGFESILIDTSIMNLPTTSLSLMANHLIKQEFGFPAGFAPSNGTYMWRKAAGEMGMANFPAVDAGVHAVSALLSDFLLFGPLSGTQRVFPAVAAAHSMMTALAFEERGLVPADNHPLALMFPDVLEQFKKQKGEG